jgi:hypothetical protein
MFVKQKHVKAHLFRAYIISTLTRSIAKLLNVYGKKPDVRKITQ